VPAYVPPKKKKKKIVPYGQMTVTQAMKLAENERNHDMVNNHYSRLDRKHRLRQQNDSLKAQTLNFSSKKNLDDDFKEIYSKKKIYESPYAQ